MDNVVEWTHHLREKDRAIALGDEHISRLRDDLDFERERRAQGRQYFLRARGERDELTAQIVTMTADIEAQKKALASAEEARKRADAHRTTLEKKIKELGEAIAFRDEAAERMSVVRRAEAKELADGRAALEVCKSQAQITWDQNEKSTV